MNNYITLFLKGIAMGAANVIPGVSGGTIAFITNVYEELIDSLKSFDLKALKLLMGFKIAELLEHINFKFLSVLFAGVFVSILSLGKLLKYLFENHQVLVWAFFFGLIVASVYFVGKTVSKWNITSILMLIIGTAIAGSIAFLSPATENDAVFYLIICGVVAISSMLLPGLSGSFVLILLGNYQLLFLKAVPEMNFKVLLPVAVGCVIGLLGLSHGISYLLKNFKDATIAILTGFILGSLLIIWPWKNEVFLKDNLGEFIIKKGEKVIQTYEWFLPDWGSTQTLLAIGLMVVGGVIIYWLEVLGEKKTA